TNLLPGRDYAIICRFNDGAGATRHVELGMYGVIHVSDGASAVSLGAAADTIVAMDYAYRSPVSLSPGPHRFAFTNARLHRHAMDFILLAKGANIDSALKVRRSGANIASLLEAGMGVLIAPAGVSAP